MESPPPAAVSEKDKTLVAALGVGVGLGGLITLIFVGIFVIWYKRRKKKNKKRMTLHDGNIGSGSPQNAPKRTDHRIDIQAELANPRISSSSLISSSASEKSSLLLYPGLSPGFSKTTFSYGELSRATDDFSSANLLGQGGFGYVYKGVLINGKEVAVKRLKIGSGQGEREFQAEIEIISRVHHMHLVSLDGYCISGTQRLLVYEFVPNKTLEFHLHGMERPPLRWATRMKIAIDSAKGLVYLHEDCQPKIIHRDIKAANILLDDKFEAKVADFGLARLNFDTDTHVSTRVMGTFGYLAPEYALTGKLTAKSDVFSFGVMLLELITGRRPIGNAQFVDDNIIDWARPLLRKALEDGNFDAIADTKLKKKYDYGEMRRMVACAAVCVRHLARRRPKMSQVVKALEGNISLDELNEGNRRGDGSINGSHGSSDYDALQYKEELKKFKKLALESECSGLTSEYDIQQNRSGSDVLGTTQEISSSSDDRRSARDENRENHIKK